MADYVIIKTNDQAWNQAIRSDTVTGLLVASLPPMGRPKKRIQTEEIDGRDGDIITELGWSAYDKKLGIGLYGEYNVDEVMVFFKEQGQVIFSNEPDRYYNYNIKDAIELERVIRFKKGTVTFHVQPYKYLKDETVLSYTGNAGSKIITNMGNIQSQPVISITGTGTTNLSINGTPVLAVALGNKNTTITIDAERLEAYTGTTLKNRSVTGDYDAMKFNVGSNTFAWSGGSVSNITVSKYTRWI